MALIQAIIDGKAVAVSDGSYKDHQGAAAWIIEGADDSVRLRGAGVTPGLPEDQSAYRSELFGLWGILDSLHAFTQAHHINTGSVVIACDGLSALKKATCQYPIDPNEAHYDLIGAIRHLRQSIPCTLTFEHVKGHQDQGFPTVLSRLASLNVQMDTEAKAKLLSIRPQEGEGRIPFEGWICHIEGRRIVKNLKESLRNHLNGKIILNHWAMKERFSTKIGQTIDWECSEKAIKGLPQAHRQWVAKVASKFLPDGKNMQRWGLRSTAQCPRCSQPVEDKEHIFTCKAESAQIQWNQSMEKLDQWMQSAKTHPQLRKDIMEGLQQWHDQIPSSRQQTEGSTAGQIQDRIGWGLALEGCIALRWREEQEAFWKAFKSRKSSRRWTIALLTRLRTTAWDMWHHRNKALHDEEANKQVILEDAVNQKIRRAYEQGYEDLPSTARTLWNRPLDRLLKFPEYYKRQWIATVAAARARLTRSRHSPTRKERRILNNRIRRIAHL